MFWQERRLTSRHSFLDASNLPRSESGSVANPLDGHRNPDLGCGVIYGSLPVLRSVPFLLGLNTGQFRAFPRRGPHRKETGRGEQTTGDRQPTPRATRPRPQSDSHQEATGTVLGKRGTEDLLWRSIYEAFSSLEASTPRGIRASDRGMQSACSLRSLPTPTHALCILLGGRSGWMEDTRN